MRRLVVVGLLVLVATPGSLPAPSAAAPSVRLAPGEALPGTVAVQRAGVLQLRLRASGCATRLSIRTGGTGRTLRVKTTPARWRTVTGVLATGAHRVVARTLRGPRRCATLISGRRTVAGPVGAPAVPGRPGAGSLTPTLPATPVRPGVAPGSAPVPGAVGELGTFDVRGPGELRTWAQAGGTAVVIPVLWANAQPAAGGPVDLTRAGLRGEDALAAIDAARAAGLRVFLELALQYPPAWAKAAIPPFRDQAGSDFTSAQPGADVRDWIWTQTGRDAVDDFTRKALTGLRGRFGSVAGIRMGGGTFGEAQYPLSSSSVDGRPSFWGYGAAAQTGSGLAAGQQSTPLPGYVHGTGTSAQDTVWAQWYLASLARFLRHFALELRAGGWQGPVHVLHPSFGVRDNWAPRSAAYQLELAHGTDFGVQMDGYRTLPGVWPWSTWADGPEPFYDPARPVDSDKAAWRKLLEEARSRGLDSRIIGENTGGGGSAAIDRLMASVRAGYTGAFYLGSRDLLAGSQPLLRPLVDAFAAASSGRGRR